MRCNHRGEKVYLGRNTKGQKVYMCKNCGKILTEFFVFLEKTPRFCKHNLPADRCPVCRLEKVIKNVED